MVAEFSELQKVMRHGKTAKDVYECYFAFY